MIVNIWLRYHLKTTGQKEEADSGRIRKKNMDKLIKEIYYNKVEKEEYNKINAEIEKQIQLLLLEEEKHMQWQEYERYRDKLFQTAFIAKESGFIEGFQYAVRLLAECFIHEDSAVP